MKKGITIAGTIVIDTNKYIEVYPVEGNLTVVKSSHETFGGCVSNTSIVLRQLDPKLHLEVLGSIGSDEIGTKFMKHMKTHQITSNRVKVLAHENTANVDAYVNQANGKRTFFYQEGANASFGIDFPKCLTTHLHIGYMLLLPYLDEVLPDQRSRLSHYLESIQEKGLRISADLVSEQSNRYQKVVKSSLSYLDDLIINEIEALEIAGLSWDHEKKPTLKDIKKAAVKIKNFGVKQLVIIHSPDFGMIYDGLKFYVVPSLDIDKERIVNSVGAGDAFCAAALYSILNNYDYEYTLRLSSCVALDVLMSQTPKPLSSGEAAFMKYEEIYRRKQLCL